MKYLLSNFILNQAEFFLKKINDVYSKDTVEIDYYLTSFLNSCSSIFDYTTHDFLNSIKDPVPLSDENKSSISWNRVKINKKRKIENFSHEKYDLILKFLLFHSKSYFKLKENNIVCYFINKRNTSVHHYPSGIPQYHFVGERKEKRITTRNFITDFHKTTHNLINENTDEYFTEDQIKNNKTNPYSVINNPAFQEIYSCDMCENEKSKFIEYLNSTDAKDLLKKYLFILKDYVSNLESKEHSYYESLDLEEFTSTKQKTN